GGGDDVKSPVAAWSIWGIGGPLPRKHDRLPFNRHELGNGMVVLGQAQPDDPGVSVRIRIPAGALSDPAGLEGTAVLTARSLMRGTPRRTFEKINDFTDSLGASIGVDASRRWVEIGLRCLREDLDEMLTLAAEVLRYPIFPEEEVEKVRKELLTGIRESEQDTRATADRGLRHLLYPSPHLLGRRTAGDIETVSAIPAALLPDYHARHFGPTGSVVSVVGGIDELIYAVDILERVFGDWSAQTSVQPDVPAAPAPVGGVERSAIAGKSQADIAIGLPTIARTHPDYYALDMANLVLGRLGLMGRLGANVRDLQGLAYYAGSALEPGLEGSIWAAKAGVDPANIDRARDSIIAELRRITTEPVSPEELNDAKSYQTGILPLALESNDGIASILMTIEHFNLGLDFLDRYPATIEALTAEDLMRAASQHLEPDLVATGIAGPPNS
ncbi:MAG: M16 family metallopeptidase, partial [Thermomicrobiales bacterium]